MHPSKTAAREKAVQMREKALWLTKPSFTRICSVLPACAHACKGTKRKATRSSSKWDGQGAWKKVYPRGRESTARAHECPAVLHRNPSFWLQPMIRACASPWNSLSLSLSSTKVACAHCLQRQWEFHSESGNNTNNTFSHGLRQFKWQNFGRCGSNY